MPNGANSVHKQLRTELENYIKSQYFGKSPILLSALNNHIDDEGLLYQRPFIESSPAYVTVQNGIETASLENWMKEYFLQLAKAGIGVFPSPFAHQILALEAATKGENLFVSTGTGSGKTECFMWPLLAKMAAEARNSKESWAKRGIRTIIMYPMNALVSDQVSRLRRMIGDPDNKFIKIFRNTCGTGVRRPQFGMYTGRTPYPGAQPSTEQDRKLERTLARMSFPQSDSEKEFFNRLLKEGKIPAKADMNQFLQGLHESKHIPSDDDAELITRFEMQQFCPDILITNYSFPKNVVSTYIPDAYGKILYEVDRGLDVAIGEYAPGRAIVVDKQTYQIGGFYYPGSERRHGQSLTPARAYTEDPNYVKPVISCPECGWFGLMEEKTKRCPFCGNSDLKITREMMRPWGFAPRNAESIPDVQLSEEYTAVQQPLYSTLPEAEEMKLAPGCKNIRIASRTNQRIIMLNKGSDDKGFMVCKDCGAAMPGDDVSVLNDINRPYKSKYARSKCRHSNCFNVNLGYDFITDMLVLEFTIDDRIIDVRRNDNPWLNRAAQSLAEALRLVASKKLDVEFTELVTGYRLRTGSEASYVDIYLYDSLSSGAGYAVSVADAIAELLTDMKELLSSCNCGSACSKCLKHYRNQYVHGMLDRFAALQLLKWGVDGINASPIKPETQIKMIMPLANILKQSGCEINSDGEIVATGRRNTKKVVVYPAMWVEPQATGTIYVSDAYIKYAKPYAVQKILDSVQ